MRDLIYLMLSSIAHYRQMKSPPLLVVTEGRKQKFSRRFHPADIT